MRIVFDCPYCKNSIDIDSEISGDRAQCSVCHRIVLVPAPGIEIGMELDGFRIERRLGVGGMGEVFEATQLAMNRRVALKVLPPSVASYPTRLNRFIHEVEMAAKLEHPNIVTAFYAGSGSGYYYLAMSYVDGQSLEKRLEEGPLKEKEVLDICQNVASALNYAWAKFNMLHRDIKPANIMIDTEGGVKLMDMGIAKTITDDSSQSGQGILVGTPYYMSPEQALGNIQIDFRSDVYSLGATVYHLVTGIRPFDGPNAMAIIAKHLSESPDPPIKRRPELSQACNELILQMMARNRDDRPESWQQLQDIVSQVTKRKVRGPSPPGLPAVNVSLDEEAEAEIAPRTLPVAKSKLQSQTTVLRTIKPIMSPAHLDTVKIKRPWAAAASGNDGVEASRPEAGPAAIVETQRLARPVVVQTQRMNAAELAHLRRRRSSHGKHFLKVQLEKLQERYPWLTVRGVLLVILASVSLIWIISYLNSFRPRTSAPQVSFWQMLTGNVETQINKMNAAKRPRRQRGLSPEDVKVMYLLAKDYAEKHPEERANARAKLKVVLKYARGTKYEALIRADLKKLEKPE